VHQRRLATEFASRDELLACLDHLLAGAGNASLMMPQLRHTLCDHAAGSYRIMTTLAAELLAAAAHRGALIWNEHILSIGPASITIASSAIAGKLPTYEQISLILKRRQLE
jgi:hypothetical protein